MFLEQLTGEEKEMIPLYQIHHKAIVTGISDLAHQHDHYLYGQEKRDG